MQGLSKTLFFLNFFATSFYIITVNGLFTKHGGYRYERKRRF